MLTTPTPSRRQRLLLAALRVLAGTTLVVVLLVSLGEQAADVRLLARLSPLTLVLLFFLPLLNFVVMACAQEMVVRTFGVSLKWREILGLQLLQRVGNLLVPGGGAAARVLYLNRKHDLPWPALSSLLLGTTIIFVFAIGATLSIGFLGISLTGQGRDSSFLAAASIPILLTLVPIWFPPRLSSRTRAQPWRFFAEVMDGWHAIARNRPLVLKMILLRSLALVPQCLIYALCLKDMGSPTGFFPVLVLVSLSHLAGWIPLSPDGIGVTESAIVLAAKMLGLDLGNAFALAIALRLGQTAVTVLVLLPVSLLARRFMRPLERKAESGSPGMG